MSRNRAITRSAVAASTGSPRHRALPIRVPSASSPTNQRQSLSSIAGIGATATSTASRWRTKASIARASPSRLFGSEPRASAMLKASDRLQ